MRKLSPLLLFVVLLFAAPRGSLWSQTIATIPDTEAAQHVGQQATVEGTVVKVFTSKNVNTFLNFGAAYPNQTFTGWIQKDSPLAADTSLQTLEGKRMRISGTINLYRGKPEIRLTTKDQIQIEDED